MKRNCPLRCCGPHEFRALLFDFDGTIVDTHTPDLQAWQEEFRHLGLELDERWWIQHLGIRGEDQRCLDRIESDLGRAIDREGIMKRQEDRLHRLVSQQPILPGIVDLLEESRRRRWANAIVSNASSHWVETHLQRLGLKHFFDLVLTREHFRPGKPDPAGYLLALEHLALRGAEALAFEDSAAGWIAAEGAGISCVHIPLAISAPSDGLDIVLTLQSLQDIPADQILARMGSSFNCPLDAPAVFEGVATGQCNSSSAQLPKTCER